jgi:hypothetical protein
MIPSLADALNRQMREGNLQPMVELTDEQVSAHELLCEKVF